MRPPFFLIFFFHTTFNLMNMDSVQSLYSLMKYLRLTYMHTHDRLKHFGRSFFVWGCILEDLKSCSNLKNCVLIKRNCCWTIEVILKYYIFTNWINENLKFTLKILRLWYWSLSTSIKTALYSDSILCIIKEGICH